MEYEFDSSVPDEFYTDLENYLQDIVDRFNIDHTVDIANKGLKDAKFKFNFTDVRIGVSLGFAF